MFDRIHFINVLSESWMCMSNRQINDTASWHPYSMKIILFQEHQDPHSLDIEWCWDQFQNLKWWIGLPSVFSTQLYIYWYKFSAWVWTDPVKSSVCEGAWFTWIWNVRANCWTWLALCESMETEYRKEFFTFFLSLFKWRQCAQFSMYKNID